LLAACGIPFEKDRRVLFHQHSHDHHSTGNHHHHGPRRDGEGHDHGLSGASPWARAGRFGLAGLLVAIAVAAACLIIVSRGEAVVITRFGDPVRVISDTGLALKAPAPIENVTHVDLRLHSFSSGLQDVGTKDGLRVLMQAYVVWRVGDQPDEIRRFLRSVRNEPDTAAAQLRSFTASTLEIASARFDLVSLVNTDSRKIRLNDLETFMRETLQAQAEKTYGIIIQQVGIERLTLPPETLEATVARMAAERMTVAQERTAEGNRIAAEIRSSAQRDARIAIANAKTEAAGTEAKARLEASAIYGDAYKQNPDLYRLLRSLDTLNQVVGDNTRLILRTDAAPFRAFVEKPFDAEPDPQP
jgi:membrane protease subunit HflC